MHSDIKEILFTEAQLKERISELGKEISTTYQGEDVTMVCVLKGAVMFFADLVRSVEGNVSLDFISCSSYGDSTISTGEVKIRKDLDHDVKGKHVLVVEDIIDTGVTLSALLPLLRKRGAKSVRLAALLSKPDRRKVEVPIDFEGFTIPDAFVVGYGLDYAEKYRNLPYIGILKEEVYQ